MKILAQGAEAIVYEHDDVIIKERISKEYRIPEIDTKLIKSRVKKEAKILEKLKILGINVPKIIKVENNSIYMEKIEGSPLKGVLKDENSEDLMKKAGRIVAQIHNNDIVHGDLTTLNFIVNDELFLIDFGLSFTSSKVEDKAVDLYVFERSLKCAHKESYLKMFYEGYSEMGMNEVLKRLEQVRLRGRKREESESPI